MAYFDFFWTEEIIEHLAQHDVTPEQFEEIVKFPESRGVLQQRSAMLLGRNSGWTISDLRL